MTQLDRLSAALWILFAAMLPFELKSPLITIGPLSITNVELAMYGVIAMWAVRAGVSFRAAQCRSERSEESLADGALWLAGPKIPRRRKRFSG